MKPQTPDLRDYPHSKSMRKVAVTALAGTSVEWYDFFLYATAAALVFPVAFFPESTPTMGLILSFGTFAFLVAITVSILDPEGLDEKKKYVGGEI